MIRLVHSAVLSTAFLAGLQSTPAVGTPNILYVDLTAPEMGDGAGWNTAFRHLQDALAAAAASGGVVTEIRMAGGVYHPDRGAAQALGDRDASFALVPGVAVRGGYAGLSGTNPDVRNANVYATILSGDLNGDDAPFGDTSDNSRHVVTVSCNFSPDTLVDGATITGGYAYDPENSDANKGAGVLVLKGSAHFTNCRVLSNYSAGQGGGFYLASPSQLKLTRCTVNENGAGEAGGGIYAYTAWNLLIDGCTFNGNHADTGGAVFCQASPATMTSSVFVANMADSHGPTFYSDLNADITIVNCTVSGAVPRWVWPSGCTLDCPYPPAPYTYGQARISNCILWNEGTELSGLGTSSSVEYCNVRISLGHPGTAIRYDDPLFVRNPDLMVYPIDYGDVHLQTGSPCIDAGNSLSPPAYMKKDVDGNSRRIDDPTVPDTGPAASYSPAIDIGAHELHQWSPADFNFDHRVNHADFVVFAACGTGPRIAQENLNCLAADLDLDGDVDALDFGLFQRCLSGDTMPADPFCLGDDPINAETEFGQCLDVPMTMDDYPYCGDTAMEYTLSGPGELTIIRRNAVYNCCPDLIEAVISPEHGGLHFEEQETASHPCACLCCFDIETKVTGLSGTYQIEYCWTRWGQPRTCATKTITIP